ncbi:MAG: methionyl aminopeptidase [Candidatus Methanomethylophilaceae archaeon]|nr:methionyl aminopeptidase [Candidatus Methanomethylophilaceae archaeon]MDI3541760.1 methionyl aminopeptidase [Candidatus Methanomethylophilaceae archaeon]
MNETDLHDLRLAGKIAARALKKGEGLIDEGVRFLDVAEEVEGYIISHGARPAFPVNLSINEVAAHFTPKSDERISFDKGDVVKIDVGAHVNGMIGDNAATVEVGTRRYQDMIASAEKARNIVMEIIGEGMPINAIGQAVERSIKEDGFVPVANLTGHEVKKYNLHAGMTIPNVDDGNTERIKDGMVLAVEPFATNGEGFIKAGRAGNIYRLQAERPIRDESSRKLYNLIKEEFGTLPFCERWVQPLMPRAAIHLNKLLRHGLISSYAMLVEVKRGCVTQSEHTVIIRGKKGEITTVA